MSTATATAIRPAWDQLPAQLRYGLDARLGGITAARTQPGGFTLLRVLWGSLSCCTTWRLNLSRRGSATPQPRVVHVVVATQSLADYGRATYATPLAAVGRFVPRSYLHVSR